MARLRCLQIRNDETKDPMFENDNLAVEYRRDGAVISTDPALLDMDVVHGFLSRVYWCEDIPREVLERAVRNSLCFGVYVDGAQVGFARVITDRATFAYLADVFIVESHRGRGLSKLMMEVVMSHPDLQGLRRFSLSTRDAHGLYRQFGFESAKMPERLMEILVPGIYKRPPEGKASKPQEPCPALEAPGANSLPAKKILFVCIGNACRSPMAEAFANHLGQGRVRASSAGLFPVGWIAPETYAVMQEKGLSLDGQSSKGLEDVPVDEMDVVVEMTGLGFSRPMPAAFRGRVVQWNIPDAFASGLECNRATRDLIEARVKGLLSEIEEAADFEQP
jgi:protein-tyrosine-phosphatase/GNAT superfamily N-acetyltransferase